MQDEIIKRAVWRYNKSKHHVQTSESGLHSDLYLNTDYVVSDVKLLERIIREVFLPELKLKPNWIITYPPFGLAVAYELARQVGAKFGYVDTAKDECSFDIKPDEKVIVVGDDIYSGGSIKKTISIVKSKGAIVESPIFTIGNFTGTEKILGLNIVSAISEKGKLYSAEDCPMCKAGSKAVLPRPNWKRLFE